MTLQEGAWIAQIVGAAITVIFASMSALVALFAYRWHRQNAKIEGTRRLSEDLRHFNQLMLGNEEMQSQAIESHRFGSLTKSDVVRMYRYFIYLNMSVNAFQAQRRGAIDEGDYNAQMRNTANITYHDRAFIKQHVLPRGYTKEFRGVLLALWEEIDRDGTLH